MANPNAIVANVNRIDPPLQLPTAALLGAPPAGGLQVHFDDGRTARLNPADPRSDIYAEVLDELRRMMVLAYVETDPATNVITKVLIPISVGVRQLTRAENGDVVVDLEISHARHLLKRSNPDFEELLKTLERAYKEHLVLSVTETETDREIIDARIMPNPPAPAAQAAVTPPPANLTFTGGPVSPQTAQQMFTLVAGQTCNPTTVPPPCIPFLYPDDGCWGRAHQMCRLISGAGTSSNKVWIYGNLQVATRNNPNCQVNWGWHVAPILQVNTAAGIQVQVIDPSLFSGPVPEATWKSVQGDPAATLATTDSSIFYRSPTGQTETDPTYAQTAQVLATYRLQLRLRSTGPAGPPPYQNCP